MSSVKEKYYPENTFNGKEISEYVSLSEGSEIILGVGPCRVGTKAQLFTMGASGFPSYDQPLKCVLRCSGHNLTPEEIVFDDGITYLKETLGPYTDREVNFDPLSILEYASGEGWITKSLTIIGLVRDPLDTWMSWRRLWGDELDREELFAHFCQSYEEIYRILNRARSRGLSVLVYEYERNKNPRKEYRKLFRSLTINAEPVVMNWNSPEVKKTIEENVRYFREPELFLPDGMRDQIESSSGIRYSRHGSYDMDRKDAILEDVMPVYQEIIRAQSETV